MTPEQAAEYYEQKAQETGSSILARIYRERAAMYRNQGE